MLNAVGPNNAQNDMWRAADVTFQPGGTCTVREYGSPGQRDIRPMGQW